MDSPSFQPDFTLDRDFQALPTDYGFTDVYAGQQLAQWSSTTLTTLQQNRTPQLEDPSTLSSIPWSPQVVQRSRFQANANSGILAFEPFRGPTYNTHIAREEYLQAGQPFFGPDRASPSLDSEHEEWILASYNPSSYAASHNSPHSQGSPISHASSPSYVEVEHHHIFTSDPRVAPKAKAPTRGRQRNLTALEKKSAREVRDAKACWACHISKTKVCMAQFNIERVVVDRW